jgi:hypothetical protein
MSNELRNPGENLNTNSDLVDGFWNRGCEVVGIGGPADDKGEEDGARDGFEEDVESAIEDGADCAKVKGEVRDRKPFWERDDYWAIGGLYSCKLLSRL